MNKNLDKKWFIAQIKPNSYQIATQNLERQGFETFLPKIDITHKKKNKFLAKQVNVFPGYLFLCFDPNIISWNKINNTYGVSKILGFNNKPSEISSDLVLALKIRYENNINLLQKEKLRIGDTIKFYRGPFTDLIAKIESLEEKNRIWVILEGIGGTRRLKLQNIEKDKYNKFVRF